MGYYDLDSIVRADSIFILPLNSKQTIGQQWRCQLFLFKSENDCGTMSGYNLKQIMSKSIDGEPNLFDSFYLDSSLCSIQRTENMLVCTKAFPIKQSKQMNLLKNILKELYIKNYPQFRYCFKSKNPLFRKFIYSFQH